MDALYKYIRFRDGVITRRKVDGIRGDDLTSNKTQRQKKHRPTERRCTFDSDVLFIRLASISRVPF